MPSTVIKKIFYNEKSRKLRIIYLSGQVYDYLNVPAKVVKKMNHAFSKGVFLNLYIKGHYEFEKIEDV